MHRLPRILLRHAPTAPDITLLQRLHRGAEAWIPLARKEIGLFEKRSVASERLSDAAHLIASRYERDGYFGINSMWRSGGAFRSHSPLERGYRRTQGLRYLNACYCDLDIYNSRRSKAECVETIGELVSAREIPTPTCTVSSGRGIWVIWVLHGQDRAMPPKGDPKYCRPEYELWKRMQESILRGLQRLDADPSACGAAGMLRIPGSLNTKSERRVTWAEWGNCSYSLTEMAAALAVPLAVAVPAGRDFDA